MSDVDEGVIMARDRMAIAFPLVTQNYTSEDDLAAALSQSPEPGMTLASLELLTADDVRSGLRFLRIEQQLGSDRLADPEFRLLYTEWIIEPATLARWDAEDAGRKRALGAESRASAAAMRAIAAA